MIVPCAVLLLISLYKICTITSERARSQAAFEALAQIAHKEEPQAEQSSRGAEEALTEPSSAPVSVEEPAPLPQYQPLWEENPDFAGWVQIPGTKLDLPVMFTPDDPEHYLHRAFDRSDSVSGTPFIGAGCSLEPRSDDLILYGHNMKDKSMFAALLSYRDQAFWQEHPCIRFDTRYAHGEYQIMSVFPIDVDPQHEHFRFYDHIDLADAQERQDFVDTCKSLSLYDTGVIPEDTSRFITLVTCSYHVKNGRFVVVAADSGKNGM